MTTELKNIPTNSGATVAGSDDRYKDGHRFLLVLSPSATLDFVHCIDIHSKNRQHFEFSIYKNDLLCEPVEIDDEKRSAVFQFILCQILEDEKIRKDFIKDGVMDWVEKI